MLVSEEITKYIHNMEPTNHVILFHDSLESKRKILNAYIFDGLKNRKGVLYVCSEETPIQIRDSLKSFGIDVEENISKGRLLIKSYDPFYIDNGDVDPLRIINQWQEIYEEMKKKGLGLRVTGETSCFYNEGKVRDLMRYEYALHRVLPIPMEAICTYSVPTIVNTGYTDTIMPLIRAHGGAIFITSSGTMIVEPDTIEDYEVERLLDIKI
jgi:hypothetical protein